MQLEREKTTIPCPKCKRDIVITYQEMFNRREAKCRRCGSMYKFTPLDASNLRTRIRDLERAQEKFGEAVQKIMSKADIVLKN